jgi:nodulation protein E
VFAITGVGVVSPLGRSAPALWAALRDGRSAIGPLGEALGGGVGATFAEPPQPDVDRRLLAGMDAFSVYSCAAAQEALGQARLAVAPERIGAVIGVGVGGIAGNDQAYRRIYGENRRPDAMTIPKVMPSAAASNVSMAFGLKGPTFATSSACASSAHAIVEATHWLRLGVADAMVAGGVEAPFTFGSLAAWRSLHILAPDTCRPFSVGRKGLVMGEGAACLVLERFESAKARGAEILAVLAGFGVTADAGHIVKPDRESIVRALRLALADAGVAPRQVGYVNAHGTGTQLNDAVESAALCAVFGDGRVPVTTSTKAATGHTLGGAGAIEAVITVGALREGFVPPTLNFIAPDPECPLDVCPNVARAADIDVALSNSFAFGGLNVSLVLRRGL